MPMDQPEGYKYSVFGQFLIQDEARLSYTVAVSRSLFFHHCLLPFLRVSRHVLRLHLHNLLLLLMVRHASSSWFHTNSSSWFSKTPTSWIYTVSSVSSLPSPSPSSPSPASFPCVMIACLEGVILQCEEGLDVEQKRGRLRLRQSPHSFAHIRKKNDEGWVFIYNFVLPGCVFLCMSEI